MPNEAQLTLSIFFPAYNDEKNINKVVNQVIKVLGELKPKDYEITIIEDGSPDKTGQVADQLSLQHDKVKVIHHKKNWGYGATLAQGFQTARFDYVFYTDGDNQYDLNELKKFVALIPYSDIVIGYRQEKKYSTYKKTVSFCYNKLLRTLFSLPYRDVNCAFKLIRTDFFNKITLKSKHGFIDAEIIIKARQLGYTITELGITHLSRKNGQSTGTSPAVILKTTQETFRQWLSNDQLN